MRFVVSSWLAFLFAGLPVTNGSTPDAGGVIWWDGSQSDNAPSGKLLSDNEGYWGERISTGMRYRYERTPTQPGDHPLQESTGRGKLLDGVPTGDLKTPVGSQDNPLTVVFDLGAPYQIHEIDLSTHSTPSEIQIEVQSTSEGEWLPIEPNRAIGNDPGFYRLTFSEAAAAQRLRVRVKAESGTVHRLSEVWIWGDAAPGASSEASKLAPDQRSPLPGMIYSFPGIRQSAFSEGRRVQWRKQAGTKQPVLWNRYELTNKPWLPTQSLDQLKFLTPRNGTASATLVLTAAAVEQLKDRLSLAPFSPSEKGEAPKARLLVAGIVETQRWGATPRPFFASDNRLPAPLLNRYLLNPSQVGRFPDVTLASGESLIVRIDVEGGGAPAGIYRSSLKLDHSGSALPLELEVLKAELPTPEVWVNSWSGVTRSMPFQTRERLKNEMAYKKELGITVWNDGAPLPGTLSAAVAAESPGLTYLLRLPKRIVDAGWKGEITSDGLNATDRTEVAEHLSLLRKQMHDLAIPDRQWFLELWDEPRARNIDGFQPVAKFIRQTDRTIPIYANPCFWIDSERGFSTDEEVFHNLEPWYSELVDISIVQIGLEDRDRFPKTLGLFNRSSYTVRGVYQHPSPNRKAVWQVFQRGWNGWGFYSYARPREDPWNDFDGLEFDYQYVYPGPLGPISTPDSEQFRACWEDYRLLTLMKDRGMDAELQQLLDQLPRYSSNADFDQLRAQALQILKSKE